VSGNSNPLHGQSLRRSTQCDRYGAFKPKPSVARFRIVWIYLYPPSERSETGIYTAFTFVCLFVTVYNQSSFQQLAYCLPRNVFDLYEKLRVFPYGQNIVGNVVLLAFWQYSQVQDRSEVL